MLPPCIITGVLSVPLSVRKQTEGARDEDPWEAAVLSIGMKFLIMLMNTVEKLD